MPTSSGQHIVYQHGKPPLKIILSIFCLLTRCPLTQPREVSHLECLWGRTFLSFLLLTMLLNASLCVMHSEAKQTETSEFGAEKGLLQGHARRTGGLSSPQTPNSLKDFSKAFLKARWGRGVPGYVISSCTILWLVDVEVTGQLTVSILRHQKVRGLRAHEHQVVDFFRLVVILASDKQLWKYAADTII